MLAPVAGSTANVTAAPVVVDAVLAVNDCMLRAFTVTVATTAGSAPTTAETFAVADVVSVDVALPLASVVAVEGVIDPLSVENVTGTPPSGLPPSSVTVAVTCVVPPAAGNVCGAVVTDTVFAAAVPILRLVICAEAPPE